MSSGAWFHIQSLAIFGLLVYGALQNRRRRVHVRVMAGAITWDFLLILQIELSRLALSKAASFSANPLALKIHLMLAISCVLGYTCLILTGWQLLRGKNALRPWHRRLGLSVLLARAFVLVTSFWAVP